MVWCTAKKNEDFVSLSHVGTITCRGSTAVVKYGSVADPRTLATAESVALVPVGDLFPDQLEQLSQTFRKALGHRQLLVTSDLLVSRDYSTQLLVTAPGAPQRRQLQQLGQQLALQGTPLAGWLMIDPELGA